MYDKSLIAKSINLKDLQENYGTGKFNFFIRNHCFHKLDEFKKFEFRYDDR